MKLWQFKSPVAIGIAIVIAVAGLSGDVLMGNTLAPGTPYIALVLTGFWFPQKTAAYLLATAATCLTLADVVISPHSAVVSAGAVSRILNISFFWIIAAIIHHMREIEAALRTETQRANLLLQEVNHRVSNKLQFVLSFLRSQSRHVRNVEAKRALDAVSSRVLAIAGLQRLISGVMTQASTVRIDMLLRSMADDLRRTLPDPGQANIMVNAQPVEFPAADTVVLGLAMNELVTNAIKHAFRTGAKGRISVRFALQPDDGNYVFEVEDDGVGMPPVAEQAEENGAGSPIVRELANLIGGDVSYEPVRPHDTARPGTRCRLVLPMPVMPGDNNLGL